MANIVFLGNFRVPYSSESHHANTLQSLGHKVLRLQETEASSDVVLRHSLGADLFIWIHTHGWETPGTISMRDVLIKLKNENVITLTYHLDLWFGLKRQKDLNKDPVYKYIQYFFTVDKKMAEWFNENTQVKGIYLPAGVYGPEASFSPRKFQRDIVFVGSKTYHEEWEYRPKLINWLSMNYRNGFEHYGNDGLAAVRGIKLNRLYASTKVVIGDSLCPNFTYTHYWSDRIYETLGRGGFLIHPFIPGLEEEFEDKKHVVFYEYNNFEQLKELIDYYLVNEEEREAIRKAGHELVKSRYTYTNRWETILEEIGL